MQPEPYRLDQLPVELLRRIASVGTCEAALALSKVNRILHTACHDHLLYKAIIDNRNGNGGPKWHHHLPLSMQSPVSSWARYALADYKARCDYDLSLGFRLMVSWAPQMIAHHHPFLEVINATKLFYATTGNTDSTYAPAFCLALRLMSEDKACGINTSWPTDEAPMSRRAHLTHYLKHPLWIFNGTPISFVDCSSFMLMQMRGRALVAIGWFSVLLREAIELGRVRRLQSNLVAIPTSTRIPFHMMMDVPLPFSPNATMEFGSCHIAKMTSIAFLEDEEWQGFYSMSYGESGTVSFDPPMRGIHFVVTGTNDSPMNLDLHGTGKDAIGTFDLDGKLASATGQLILRKVYSGGSPAWEWVCLMTPVGIVGNWGQGSYGGWVWLWKAGWTAD